jgi:hypothetical protein
MVWYYKRFANNLMRCKYTVIVINLSRDKENNFND